MARNEKKNRRQTIHTCHETYTGQIVDICDIHQTGFGFFLILIPRIMFRNIYNVYKSYLVKFNRVQ